MVSLTLPDGSVVTTTVSHSTLGRRASLPIIKTNVTSVPSAEVLATGRMNALRQGRKRKLPQVWGLLTWKLTRAAKAQW